MKAKTLHKGPKRLNTAGVRIALIGFLFLGAVLPGCKKEATTWDSRYKAPLFKSELQLENIFPGDEGLQEQGSNKLHLVETDTLYKLPMDSVLLIPDTTLTQSYQAPVGGTDIAPGDPLIDTQEDRDLEVDPAELRRAVLDGGKLQYELSSTIAERTIFRYRIPKARKNGQALEIERSVPAGDQGSPSTVSGVKDLEGYDLDLTGPNGGAVNRFRAEYQVITDPNGDTVTLDANDEVRIENRFRSLVPAYAKGYFGQHTIAPSYRENSTGLFQNVRSGDLDIDSVNVRLIVDNGIGMDGQLEIPLIRAIGNGAPVDLQHSITQSSMNIARAQEANGSMDHTVLEEELTPQNSNIDRFLEVLPRRVGHELSGEMNPMGDVSNGNDVLIKGHGLHVRMRIDLPLSFIANDLTLVDTVDWKIGKRGRGELKEGTLYLDIENGFPLAQEFSIHLHEGNGDKIGTLFEDRLIPAASTDASWKVTASREKRIRISISPSQAELIRKAERASIVARANTPANAPHIDLYKRYELGIQASGDFEYRNRVE